MSCVEAGRKRKGPREEEETAISEEPMEQEEKQAATDNNAERARKQPLYPPMKKQRGEIKEEIRRVSVPAHRYTPLKENWPKIFQPLVEHLKLQVRFNLKTRNVEIRNSPETENIGDLQKAADFVKAFIVGFEPDDALALLRMEDLFVESFDVRDVKPLKGDHLSRAIGRLAGKGGRTKFTIENVTKTRIVLADSKIHLLGSYQNIAIARRAICNLILGSPPSKVYGNLRSFANRASDRF